MPAPFKQITREQFAQLLSTFPFQRKINAVHMHHTWRPNHAQYRGHDTIVGMWRFHTETNGWSDIAQHVSIAPDGSIWLGRDWNRAPASAAGHNGNAQAGPFMFETIGDFDEGRDPFGGAQRDTVVDVIARVQQRFGLPPGTLQFHNMMSTKSCPGTGIDFHDVLKDVAQRHQDLIGSARAAPRGDGPFSADQVELQRVVKEAIASLQEGAGLAPDPFDAEPCAHGPSYAEAAGRANARGGIPASSRGNRFSAFELDAMRPHIVNLRKGQFSSSGDWTTSASEVDAIFDQHLPLALEAARKQHRPLRLMFYAHGGLNDEASALAAAHARIAWWQSNDIYPIYFIWETGLGETLGQMLESWQQRRAAGRNLFSDHVSDPLIEAFAHRTLGVNLWDTMKTSAERASADAGGARYVAEKLAAFIDRNQKSDKMEIEVHAAGHSAGAIFHTHFLPCALACGLARVDSLHLLAPAVRADLFRDKLYTFIGAGKGVENLTVYTMTDSFEKNDHCALVYRKSLLYLIYKGLEFDADTPILGLERCLRDNADLRRLFGLAGAKATADVVWSDNRQERGRSASRARSHGSFDDDPATMGSIVRRVLGKQDADPIVELPPAGRAAGSADLWRAAADEWDDVGQGGWQQPTSGPGAGAGAGAGAWGTPPWSTSGGRRRALCVGIDNYRNRPLTGCVNDARDWGAALASLGFEHRLLLDGAATKAGIERELTALVEGSRAGDVIVFHYSGHGSTMPDQNGDEADGDTPGTDEALCPFDVDDGAFLIDDDIAAIFSRLPDGVNLTCFFDCCFSGTITRMAYGLGTGARPAGARARFIPPSRALIDAFLAKRRSGAGSRGRTRSASAAMREVVFSACLSSEEALENQGHGDFTTYALQVLRQGIAGLSNADFAARVTQAFGSMPQQHAKLYSSDTSQALALLQPLGSPQPAPSGPTGPSDPSDAFYASAAYMD